MRKVIIGDYVNLVDGGIWDAEAASSSLASPTKAPNADMVLYFHGDYLLKLPKLCRLAAQRWGCGGMADTLALEASASA